MHGESAVPQGVRKARKKWPQDLTRIVKGRSPVLHPSPNLTHVTTDIHKILEDKEKEDPDTGPNSLPQGQAWAEGVPCSGAELGCWGRDSWDLLHLETRPVYTWQPSPSSNPPRMQGALA